MEPAYMHHKHTDADAELRQRVRWHDNADEDVSMFRSLWAAIVARVGHLFGHVRFVDDEPRQSNQSSQPAEPGQSSKPHKPVHTCPRHPERTCDCDDDGDECHGDADGVNGDEWVKPYTSRAGHYYDQIDHQRNDRYLGKPFPVFTVPRIGAFECPTDGKACGAQFCERGRCEESVTRSKAGANWCYAQAADDS